MRPLSFLARRFQARRAAAGQQYAILVGLIGVVAILAIASAGGSVNLLLGRTANTLGGTVNLTGSSGGGGGGGGGGPDCVITRATCLAHLQAGCTTTGTYTINPGGGAFTAWCDMTTMGGGWTLFSQNRPVSNVSLALNVSGAVGTLELNDTTITNPAKLSDTLINQIAPGREFMAKSRYEGHASASISAYTDVCRINLKDTVSWNSASNTPVPTINLDSTTLVCSQNTNMAYYTLTPWGSPAAYTYALGFNLNVSPEHWLLYTADTGYTGGTCATANAGRSWVGPGNWGCNAVKWYGR